MQEQAEVKPEDEADDIPVCLRAPYSLVVGNAGAPSYPP